MHKHLVDKLEELEHKGFTGNVTLHYLVGRPLKIRLEEIYDLGPGKGPPRLHKV